MILVDTSIWIDHFRHGEPELNNILKDDRLLIHPAIIGELALGSLHDRKNVLALLAAQRKAIVVTHGDVLTMIDRLALFSMGIGYTDSHILGSVLFTPHASLWTRDRRLLSAAEKGGAQLYRPQIAG
ncbi:PIN domain-containing protein [Neorhizobium sp. JUb45]|uniref:type II toxin-antitoxin system VapC family toxin n=1 Tax=unclassified Neorhizobium TaxID=2629175 RepID=UPI001048EDA5|nr:PIN domain-containing protein [Neorhizobium sp. JUb45]TCR04514.1 hypothetical protein EDF70_102613 [Neorhizobium sp. JUb45]